jgi:hypothetical protein
MLKNTVGTFVGNMPQKGGQKRVVPTVSLVGQIAVTAYK